MSKHSDEPKIEGITLSEKRIKELFELNRKSKLYYSFRRFVHKFSPQERARDIKYAYQRVHRGWADPDMWSVDYYLASIIPPMLRELAVGNSYPGLPPYDTAEKWEKACNEAADDLEAFYKQDELPFPKTRKARDKYFADMKIAQERTLKGARWLAENWFSLWD